MLSNKILNCVTYLGLFYTSGFDRRMVTAAMALPVTQAVLKMGFSETLVRDAIESKLRATGQC